MTGGINEKIDPTGQESRMDNVALEEKDVHYSELKVDSDAMNQAYAAENAEHELSAWQAVRTHPMACFWAFLMCFTIVSSTCTHHCLIRRLV